MFFSPRSSPLHLFLGFLPPSLLLSISHHLCHNINVRFSLSLPLFSLPQPAARQCRRRMSQCWKEARPRSPAACTTTTDQSWSSRTLAGRLSSSTAQEVRRRACSAVPSLWINSSPLTFADLPFLFRHISEKLARACALCFFPPLYSLFLHMSLICL